MSSGGHFYYQQAENALSKFRLFGKENKWSEAAELFTKSGHSYKSVRDWIHAGESYHRASECLANANKLDEAAIVASDAGKMFSKQSETSDRALQCYFESIRFYRENSKPINAARLLNEAGKIFQDMDDTDKAISVYGEAAQIYDDENQSYSASVQLATVADLLCSQKKFVEASDIYKNVAIRRINDRMTQMSSGEYCTKSVVCRLAADDVVGAEMLLNEFVNLYPAWERSRECHLLTDCAAAVNNHDSGAFSQAVAEYDQMRPLDSWMANNLLIVKNLIDDSEIDIL